MQNYLDILRNVFENGVTKVSAPRGLRQTSISTRSLFCVTFRHDMSLGFPLLTTKKMNFKAILAELLWFLSGDENAHELQKYTTIWKPWEDAQGRIPSAYGVRWRYFRNNSAPDDGGAIDQVTGVLELLKRDPSSRRGVVVAWDARCDLSSALPPCHVMWIINISKDKVNLHLTMRSTDVPIGLPYNIASYAILLQLFANWLNLECGELCITMVDCHIYGDQEPGVITQLERVPSQLPTLQIDPSLTLAECHLQDPSVFSRFELVNYVSQPFIKFPVAL